MWSFVNVFHDERPVIFCRLESHMSSASICNGSLHLTTRHHIMSEIVIVDTVAAFIAKFQISLLRQYFLKMYDLKSLVLPNISHLSDPHWTPYIFLNETDFELYPDFSFSLLEFICSIQIIFLRNSWRVIVHFRTKLFFLFERNNPSWHYILQHWLLRVLINDTWDKLTKLLSYDILACSIYYIQTFNLILTVTFQI